MMKSFVKKKKESGRNLILKRKLKVLLKYYKELITKKKSFKNLKISYSETSTYITDSYGTIKSDDYRQVSVIDKI